jgi:hypothetical protein
VDDLTAELNCWLMANARFDPEKAVMAYREAVAQLEAQTNETAKDILRVITRRQREELASWQGERDTEESPPGPSAFRARREAAPAWNKSADVAAAVSQFASSNRNEL